MHDFGHLICSQLTGIILKNPNIEIRNPKQYKKS